MRMLFGAVGLVLLAACGSGGPPPPDWKTDSADLIDRYQKHALLGDNVLAERYFQQAVAATGGAGHVVETARLWLVRCATRRAMLLDDSCSEYAALAITPHPGDHAYYQFITLRWEGLDAALLPAHHRNLVLASGEKRSTMIAGVDDPLARLLDASLLVMRQEATRDTLETATETASERGWRRPLLTYLKLQHEQAVARNDAAAQQTLTRRIQLVEQSLLPRKP